MSSSQSVSTKLRGLALLVWILVIFLFSTDSFSSAETSGVIIPTLRFLFPLITPAQLEFGHIVCRKAGHLLEYFVLGVLAWRAFGAQQRNRLKPWLAAATLVLVVALTDEFHQSFVPSRTSSLTDVGYDFTGGIIALLFMPRLCNETRNLRSHPVL